MEHKNKKTNRWTKISVLLSKKHILKLVKSTLLECQVQRDEKLENDTGVVFPNESLAESTQISFTSSLSISPSENKFYIYVSNFADDFVTLPFNTETKFLHSNV